MRMLNRVQSYCFFPEPPKKNPIIIVSSSSFCPDNLGIPWLGVDNLPLRGCGVTPSLSWVVSLMDGVTASLGEAVSECLRGCTGVLAASPRLGRYVCV